MPLFTHKLYHLSICGQTYVVDLSILVGSFAIVHGCQSFRRTLLVLFNGFTDLDRRRHLEISLFSMSD